MRASEETLTVLNGQPKNAKSAIIQKLAKQWPLTTKQLSHSIQREYGLAITYQAVHKAIQELEKEKILQKGEKGYQLHEEWIQTISQLSKDIAHKYAGNRNRYEIDLKDSGLQKFEFDNFTDFCVETAKLVADKVLCKNNETAFFILEYGWWTLKFRFEHLSLLYKLVNSSPKSVHLIRKVTPFGNWIHKQYEKVGGTGEVGKKILVEDDFLIQGDWIIQIHFSKNSKELFEKYWNKWRSLEDCFKEFGLKDEPVFQINVSVFKNPDLVAILKSNLTSRQE